MEERSKLSVFWKKHYKLVFLFFIRLAEVFMSSAIPSFRGVVLIFLNPNKNIWTIVNFITLILFALINFRFLLKYIAGRDNKWEFYILNGIVYIIYVAASILAFKFAGYLVYSMIFANLRGLEAFGMKTFQSILICDAITLVSMFILGRYAYSHTDFIKKLIRMNGADAIEMTYREYAPTQNSEEVRTLSVEEMEKEIEKDMKEAAEVVKQQAAEEDERVNAVKGNNEAVRFVTPENPDDDIDETDFVEANTEIINKNVGYDSDSLWEKDIYKDGAPITDYEDEYESAPAPEDMPSIGDRIKGTMRHHIRSVTRTVVVRRKNRLVEVGFDESDYDERELARAAQTHNDSYDSESLWEAKMYQGQSEENVPEYGEDFDDIAETRKETGLEDYDGDNLWNTDVYQGRK